MNEPKYACVIDTNGYYVTRVLMESIPKYLTDGSFTWMEQPHAYDLKEGESLLYVDPPTIATRSSITHKATIIPGAILKPCWDGESWEESATSEEIEAAQSEPVKVQPTEMELVMAEMSMAMAQIQQNFDMAVAEMSMIIAMKGDISNV